jgi:hypothetical protein
MEKKHLVVFSEENDFDSDFVLKCPVCGDDYSHIQRISDKGIHPNEDKGNQGFAKIVFSGECGHYFSLCFDGHKGNIYCYFLEEDSIEEKDFELFELKGKYSELQRENIELKEKLKK